MEQKNMNRQDNALKTIRVIRTDSDFEREDLSSPFGFKGGYLTELWQTVVKMEAESGNSTIGVATQSVLYGDSDLFVSHAEAGGNALMYALTDKALQLARETSFTTPPDLLDKLLPEVKKAGIQITGKQDLNENFIYNALISVDNAAWLLYASENGLKDFDAMLPAPYERVLPYHNKKIAVMFAVPYGMAVEEIKSAVKQGYFIFKIKTGYPGTQAEMLQQDMNRLTEIHRILRDVRTGQTENGRVKYTMDANGRYEKKETLMRYLDHARKIGAFEQILLYEEPLEGSNEEDVSDAGVRIAGDESIQDEASALHRLSQGYSVFVLKGIAKTLSLSLKLARLAQEKNVPCLCADLTVNPILVDWHKNLAARLAPFPELGMGLMETNGASNYQNWQGMTTYHPAAGALWTKVRQGVFELDSDFYQRSGGIFEPSAHYQALLCKM